LRRETGLRSFTVDPEFIRELFAQFGPVTVRRMFNSAGIFADGVMIGLINKEAIYLKTDEISAPDFEREGSKPFSYIRGKGGRVELPYWRLPERLYDDPDELATWARRAFEVAERKKLKTRAQPKRRPASRRKK
jgi:DNA transformation protein and related proteins